MKIFYIDPQSYNNLADYDKYLLENIPCKKDFFCSNRLPYTEITDANIHRLYLYSKRKFIFKIISYILSQRKLLRLIKKQKPDVIHFQWFKIPSTDYRLLKKIKRLSPASKIIFTAHNILPHDSGAKYRDIYIKIYKTVDKVIAHCEDTRQKISDFADISDSKIYVIPHGFLPVKKTSSVVEKSKKITFSFIGYMSEYKGLDILLEAWINSPEILNSSDCQLIIAGAGQLKILESIPAEKNIIVENYFHSDEELAQIVSMTDVAVLPYRVISQSGVLLTYLAENKPVIVSNTGGLSQPFEIGNVGWLLNDCTVENLRDVIIDIIKNPSSLEKIKQNIDLWNHIADFYSWKTIGEKTLRLYFEK